MKNGGLESSFFGFSPFPAPKLARPSPPNVLVNGALSLFRVGVPLCWPSASPDLDWFLGSKADGFDGGYDVPDVVFKSWEGRWRWYCGAAELPAPETTEA